MLELKDPQSGKVWRVEKHKKIKNIYADVYERWVINCVVSKETLKEIIPIDYLEPVPYKGKYILSLCAIFMRHAAPGWMPLQIGPSSHNCALRIACVDKRDGSQAVWVGARHTDSFLGPVLELLSFPPACIGLKVEQNEKALSFETVDKSVCCYLTQGKTAVEREESFDEYFCAGIRSYSRHAKNIDVIDLHKLKDNKFTKLDMQGVLKTSYGEWPVESVFLTKDGLYKWVYEGRIISKEKP